MINHNPFNRALDYIEKNKGTFLSNLISIGQIPAPTGQEEQRASFLFERFEDIGINAYIDAAGNVVAEKEGDPKKPSILWVAHLDTVFDKKTDHVVHVDQNYIYGPGIADNCVGLAVLIRLAHIIQNEISEGIGHHYFAAVTGSEIGGNLYGMREVMGRLKEKITTVICLEGNRLGRIDHYAIGTYRFEIEVKTMGGHSWHDRDNPNAIRILHQFINQIETLSLPADSSINYAKTFGGTTYNLIPDRAILDVELRSNESRTLDKVFQQIKLAVSHFNQSEGDYIELKQVGLRPYGGIPADHPLVKVFEKVLKNLGIVPRLGGASSDGAISLSMRIPTVTIGLTNGFDLHTEKERVEIDTIFIGIRQAVNAISEINSGGL